MVILVSPSPCLRMSPPLPLTLSRLGDMGFISVAECEVLRNNALINIHMAHSAPRWACPAVSSPRLFASAGTRSPASWR